MRVSKSLRVPRLLLHFGYVIPNQLAGMGRPPEGPRLHLVLAELFDQGIRAVASLTEWPIDERSVRAMGMDFVHLPVEDFTAPTIEQIREFAAFADRTIAGGGAVVAHCMAGLGRTGTMLACYLVHRGSSPQAAIETVRRARPGSIEIFEQESVIRQWAEIRTREGHRT